MKKCDYKGCLNNQFGGGYCSYHQYVRRMKGGDLFKPKPRQSKPINKESPKRKKENKRYLDLLKEQWELAVINKTNYCFICGEYMPKREDNHHLYERENNKLLDTEYWSWAHRKCHDRIHFDSIEKLLQETWYQGYLQRLKERDQFLYFREIKKQEKNLRLDLE